MKYEVSGFSVSRAKRKNIQLAILSLYRF